MSSEFSKSRVENLPRHSMIAPAVFAQLNFEKWKQFSTVYMGCFREVIQPCSMLATPFDLLREGLTDCLRHTYYVRSNVFLGESQALCPPTGRAAATFTSWCLISAGTVGVWPSNR